MKKNKLILIFTIPFIIGWSKEVSIPKCCSGIICLNAEQQELVDIKIGTSIDTGFNRDIIVYKKPQMIEYKFNLDQISEITTKQEDLIYKTNDEEYVNISVTTKNQKVTDLLIERNKKVLGKLKDTGWSASYPFEQIKNIIIKECIITENTKD